MATSWFGRSRRSPQDEAAARFARDAAVAAFLDLDTRQRFITEAIGVLRSLEPHSPVLAPWKRVEQTCFDASTDYLSTSERYPLENSPTPVDTQAAIAAYQQTHRAVAAAATAASDFYAKYRRELDHARAVAAATPRIADEAVQRALAARSTLAGQGADVANYRSVRAAAANLETATRELDRALAGQSIAGIGQAAARIHAIAGELDGVVAAARTAGTRAGTAIASVQTRIDAVTTHIERLPQARSALLREFSAPNSADLVGNLDVANRELAQGRQDWQAARAALSAGNPEDALDSVAASRTHLTKATEACDVVTDRLDMLRTVRTDPTGPERRTRFRIRDTQRLVVDRGLTKEWGSVLDAQSNRVDRAREKLVGVHPNYWAYLAELDAVQKFVEGIVERIREQAKAH